MNVQTISLDVQFFLDIQNFFLDIQPFGCPTISFYVQTNLLDAQMEQTAVAMKEAYTVGGMFKNSLWGMIMWAFVSLIVAAINKRNRPSEFA